MLMRIMSYKEIECIVFEITCMYLEVHISMKLIKCVPVLMGLLFPSDMLVCSITKSFESFGLMKC